MRFCLVATAMGLACAVLAGSQPAWAGSPACESRVNNTHAKLLECVTLDGVRAQQAALQAIADANGGTRATGTPGYTASVAYVRRQLEAAGYLVELDPFPFTFFPPALLRQQSPVVQTYETGVFTGSGFGDITAAVTPVDVVLGLPRDPVTSGCDAGDFAGFPAGSIALVQRGGCNFSVKAINAAAAGASAVIIFNQGNSPEREGLIVGTLGGPNVVGIPVVGASFEDGAALAQTGSTARVKVDPPEQQTQYNVLAELPGRRSDNTVMVGAHLDSVQAGPGIQDNGSGSAAILDVALKMARVKPVNTVRFAWWGGEESGLIGSTAYVDGLTEAEQAAIALYLNFDMIGSPNYVFFVYDGDDSDRDPTNPDDAGPGPEGSAQIEALFESFYATRTQPFTGTDFDGRSDYGPFIAVGIPSGGLFTGAEDLKTAEQAALWGGTAGSPYDPCYHLACDTYANINDFAYDTNADAVAYATLQYAMNTQAVNGVRGKGNFKAKQQQGAATAARFTFVGPRAKR